MAIKLNVLLKKVSHMDITAIAGEQGFEQMVTWVHMVETPEAATFLEGGEMVVLTGIGLNPTVTLLELVKAIYEHNASGAVLNIGPFLEHIPMEVIHFANEHNFPLFTVPWKIHIAEIIRIFCFTITKSDQRNQDISSAFKNAIFFPKSEELYVVPLSKYGFKPEWNYYVGAISIMDEHEAYLSEKRQDTISSYLDNHMRHMKYNNFALFHYDNQLLFVLGSYNEVDLKEFVTTITEKLQMMLTKDECYYIGIGKCTKSIRCIHKSYRQSLAIQNLQKKKKISKSLISYTNMGIYKLLMGIEDKEIIQEYFEHTIQPLLQYDKENNSDLSIVLQCYLMHDGSVKETADELYVHRNTVNYKLSKIQELLHINLSSLDTRLQLNLGFMLRDML